MSIVFYSRRSNSFSFFLVRSLNVGTDISWRHANVRRHGREKEGAMSWLLWDLNVHLLVRCSKYDNITPLMVKWDIRVVITQILQMYFTVGVSQSKRTNKLIGRWLDLMIMAINKCLLSLLRRMWLVSLAYAPA